MYSVYALNFCVKYIIVCKKNWSVGRALPKRGTASEVAGIVSATMFRKTVNDKRIVTPLIKKIIFIHAYCGRTLKEKKT